MGHALHARWSIAACLSRLSHNTSADASASMPSSVHLTLLPRTPARMPVRSECVAWPQSAVHKRLPETACMRTVIRPSSAKPRALPSPISCPVRVFLALLALTQRHLPKLRLGMAWSHLAVKQNAAVGRSFRWWRYPFSRLPRQLCIGLEAPFRRLEGARSDLATVYSTHFDVWLLHSPALPQGRLVSPTGIYSACARAAASGSQSARS